MSAALIRGPWHRSRGAGYLLALSACLAEARPAEAQRWKGHFEKLYRDGFASEERFLSARDAVLTHESRVAGEKAGVSEAELRVKQAKRRMDHGEFPLVPQETRLAELEQRLAGLERSVDQLQQEVGNLRRMLRPLWKIPDNVEREPVMKPRGPRIRKFENYMG